MKTQFVTLFLVLTQLGFAQSPETIVSDRPGQSNSPLTVGKGVFQNQTGYQYLNETRRHYGETHQTIETVCRFGLTDAFELGAAANYTKVNTSPPVGLPMEWRQVDDLSLRLRNTFYRGAKGVSTFGLQAEFGFPINTLPHVIRSNYYKVALMTSHSIFPKLSLGSNIGFGWDGFSTNAYHFYTLNIGFAITKKLGVFVEQFGWHSRGEFIPRFDAGFSYLLNSNFQIDLFAGGKDQDFEHSQYFISGGISWRLQPRKET